MNEPVEPYRRLVAATLGRALLDLFVGERLQRASARSWLLDRNNEEAFSFIWCCEHLNLHVENMTAHIVYASIEMMNKKEAEKALQNITDRILN